MVTGRLTGPLADRAPAVDRGGSLVVVVHGEVDMSSVSGIDERIGQAWAQRGARRQLVLDLAAVRFFSLAGVNLLLEWRRRCLTQDGALALRGAMANRRVARVLTVSRTDAVFDHD